MPSDFGGLMGTLRGHFGRRVQQLRKALGHTQERLGHLADTSGKVIGEIERGERNPTLETVERLIRAFDVEPYELFLFSLKEAKPLTKVDDEVLVNLIRRTNKAARPYIINLVQTALRWTQSKK